MEEAYQDPKRVASFGGVDALHRAVDGDIVRVSKHKILFEKAEELFVVTECGTRHPILPVYRIKDLLEEPIQDVALNERGVSSSSNTYPYHAYVETLLNYSEDAKKSLLTCECFYKDTFLDVSDPLQVAVVAEWYRYRTVACFVTGSSPKDPRCRAANVKSVETKRPPVGVVW
ncbi:uncharacterized protein TNCV_1359011 [Trichonephila clavipes]|nr:uncharacterized protein TNCV_1359011 [Trichonephila clavipes]